MGNSFYSGELICVNNVVSTACLEFVKSPPHEAQTTDLRDGVAHLSHEHVHKNAVFSRWRISAILNFRDPIMGSLSPGIRLP